MVNLREVPGEFAFTMNRPKNIIWLFCLISRFRLIFSCYSRSHTISNFSCVQPVRYFVLFSAGVPRDFAPFILDRANFAKFFFLLYLLNRALLRKLLYGPQGVFAAFPLCTAMLVSYGIISEIQYVFLKKKHNLINSYCYAREIRQSSSVTHLLN